MLTAKICVTFEDDWTADLGRFDVSAEFLASRFRDRHYIGLLAIETDRFDAVVDLIGSHPTIESVDPVERIEVESGQWAGTLFIEGQLDEATPLQRILAEGFLPLRSATLENGRECFDLLLADRDELARATAILEAFGPVTLERVTEGFRREIVPSRTEWQAILQTMPSRRREILDAAIEEGYYEIPRSITLDELAECQGISKSTASDHLRKAEKEVLEFMLPYLKRANGADR